MNFIKFYFNTFFSLLYTGGNLEFVNSQFLFILKVIFSI
jgi:hypothetical protein